MSEPTRRRGRRASGAAQKHHDERADHGTKVRRRASTGLIVAVVIGLIALTGVIAVSVVLLRRPSTVPSVLMMTEAEATQALGEVRLKVGDISHVATSAVGAGLVLAQRPGEGSEAIDGAQVDLTFAEQPRPAPVANVVGAKRAAAEAKLRAAQFVPRTYSQFSDTVAAGAVVAQLPAAGTGYQTGSPVIISVSLGKAHGAGVVVPAMTGSDEQSARQALASAGLVGYWLYNTVSSQAPGRVLGQLPAPGVRVPAGAQVAGWVAGEPAP